MLLLFTLRYSYEVLVFAKCRQIYSNLNLFLLCFAVLQDDSKPLRTILVRLLTLEHHTCFEAVNGLEAFAMIKRSLIARSVSSRLPSISDASVVYDLIVMDRNMPEMSGVEATLAIRKAGYKGPIIGVSGDIDNGEFVAAGANLVMEKPVPFDEMKKTIAKVMQGSHKSTKNPNQSSNPHNPRAVPTSHLTMSPRPSQRLLHTLSQRLMNSTRPAASVHPTGSSRARDLASRFLHLQPRSSQSKIIPAPAPAPDPSPGLAPVLAPALSPTRPSRPTQGLMPVRNSLLTTPAAAAAAVVAGTPVPAQVAVGNVLLSSSGQGHGQSQGHEHGHGHGQGVVGRQGSVVKRQGSVAGRDSLAQADSLFASDAHVALGWEKIFSYRLSFIDPRFDTSEMRAAFVEYRRSGLNHKLLALLCVVSLVVLATRGSLAILWGLNPAFLVAFLAYVAGSLCIATSFVNRLAVISYRRDIKVLQPYHAAAVKFATSRYAVAFESAALLCMTMCAGTYVLARTLQGPCPPHTTIWDEQQCNPDAATHNIPQDTFLSAVMATFGFQVFINSASKRSVAASWVILLALVNASMVVVGSSLLVWNNLLLVCGVCVSYEFERWV